MSEIHGFVPQTDAFCTYQAPCANSGRCSTNDFLYGTFPCEAENKAWIQRQKCSRIDPSLCPAFSEQEPISGDACIESGPDGRVKEGPARALKSNLDPQPNLDGDCRIEGGCPYIDCTYSTTDIITLHDLALWKKTFPPSLAANKPAWDAILAAWCPGQAATFNDDCLAACDPTEGPRPVWCAGESADTETTTEGTCPADTSAVSHGKQGTCGEAVQDGETCRITCDTGYQVSGADRTCESGALTGTRQTCKASGSVTPPPAPPPAPPAAGSTEKWVITALVILAAVLLALLAARWLLPSLRRKRVSANPAVSPAPAAAIGSPTPANL